MANKSIARLSGARTKRPTSWQAVALGEIASGQYGLSEPAVAGGSVAIVGMRNLEDGYVTTDDLPRINLQQTDTNDYRLIPGDVLFNRTNSYDLVGKTAIVEHEPAELCVFASYLVRLRVDRDRALPAFVCYAMNSGSGQLRLKSFATPGVSQYNINPTALRQRFILNLPPIDEQAAIVRVLQGWDQQIRNASNLVNAKRDLRQALMQRLLTGKQRLSGCAQPWLHCRIGDVLVEAVRPVKWDDNCLYRLVSVRRWAGGVFLRDEIYGRNIKVKKLNTIRTGDMLISHIQSAYGAMAPVGPEFDGLQVSELYTVLVPRNPEIFDIRFFAYLARSRAMWHRAYLASNGFFAERLRLNFSPEDFLRQPIYVPPTVEEQRRIADVLAASDRELQLLERYVEVLKRQKKGLMQKLLTGQIRVKV